MSDVKKFSLVGELNIADNTLQGSPAVLGISGLTYPQYINSMRTNMFTSHTRQFMNIINNEAPKVFTGLENTVGKYSSSYYKTDENYTVYKKIEKYEDILDKPEIFVLFLYDKKHDRYTVVDRIPAEDLTENFGYEYDNNVIDSLSEGDEIQKGTNLYKSISYDDDMNYAYGANVVTMYTNMSETSEDSAVAAKSLENVFVSTEVDTFKILLNSNDYLINLYGDKDKYKPLPDIGDFVSGKFAAVRRLFNSQLLHDFNDDNLRKIQPSDDIYYIEKDEKVIDFTILDNNDEPKDSPFYEQIYKYAKLQDKYWREIYDTCVEIMDSGADYTSEFDYMYKTARDMIDKKSKWKEKDNIYDNIEIVVTLIRRSPLTKGCKISGRYGNKTVISKVVPDELMPITEDGRRVKLILSILSIPNRTTSMVLFELFITGCGSQVRNHMKTLKSFQEKEDEAFKFIKIFNKKQHDKFYGNYLKYDKATKEKFINDIIDFGFLIHIPSLWEDQVLFYSCLEALEAFPYLKEDTVYVNKWGRMVKTLTKQWIGEMYCIKLKQSGRRGFSARSTGAISPKELPTRSFKSKAHLEHSSSSCIRFGEFESLNFSIGVYPVDIALFHALYRTSVKGRRDIVASIFNENGVMNLDKSYTSRVAELFNVTLKSIGIGFEFRDKDNTIKVIDNNTISRHEYEGTVYMCTDYQFYLMVRMKEIQKDILRENPILTEKEFQKLLKERLQNDKYVIGDVDADLGLLEKEMYKEIEDSLNKVSEELSEEVNK